MGSSQVVAVSKAAAKSKAGSAMVNGSALNGGGLKRGGLVAQVDSPPAKVAKSIPLAMGDCDEEGRHYDFQMVVVSFASVGFSYAVEVLGKNPSSGPRLFDWDGVRQCVQHLKFHMGLKVIGVIFE